MKLQQIIILSLLTVAGSAHAQAPPTAADRGGDIRFTRAELRFMENHPVVRVGMIPGFAPYMFLGEDGAFQGVFPDYLKLVSDRAGIMFDLVPIKLTELDAVIGRDADMFPGLESAERLKRMNFTETVLSDPWVLVNRRDAPALNGLWDLKGRRVAVVRDIYIHKRMKSDYPDIEIRAAKDHPEALRLVSAGQADAYVGPLAVAGRVIQHHRLTNLKVAAPAGYPGAHVKFGVRKDWPELVLILNEVLAGLTRQEMDAVMQKWVPVTDERPVEWSKFGKWIVGIIAGLSVLLSVFLFWNRKLAVEIRERKKAEGALRRIEWLLTKSVDRSDLRERTYEPPYGDVTALNAQRTILDGVGKETLGHIAEDTIDLLDTSVAVYEKNGDYAFGMFSSGWCRLFDLASRNLCDAKDNREALACGKWLCHENCWNDSAMAAMHSGRVTDIACVGGIRLYAVPIYAGDEIIGVINIGYGDPPSDEQTLLALSERFNIDLGKIREAAERYQSRPMYIIELAKKRLQTAADLIGEIVERKRVEDALREREESLEIVFANMPIALFAHDLDGRIVMTNRMAEEYTGYTREELLRRTVADIDHESVTRDDRNRIWKELNKGGSRRIESVHFRKDGSRYHAEIHIAAITFQHQPVIIGLAQDITARKAAEEKLQEYSQRLEEMVAERTEELGKAHEKLRMKERLAVLMHFSGGVSHELRNPLAAIDSSAYYLNMTLGAQNEKAAEHLGRIRNNVKKSADILQSLLNLSRMEKPAADCHDLRGLIHETLRSSHLPDAVEAALSMPQTEVYMDMDMEQIRMALKNVIKNAVEAMDGAGKLTVTVQACGAGFSAGQGSGAGFPARQKPQAGMPAPQPGMAAISIADTGPGVAEKHIEKIFDPLFTTKIHGIGFGLTIAKMIIENHGGTVRAATASENAHETGATFIITLPLADKGGPQHV